jgi:3-phosphoshikimate 1-carboxyvinyltransferase
MIQILNAATSLSGTVQLPGDKSISHRYAMLAAIAEGVSVIRHFAASRDCHSTLGCLQTLGVKVQESGESVTINGRGLRGFSGILAGHPFESSITGDASLAKRPMGRIMQPLRLMGAAVDSLEQDLPPIKIRGGGLKGIRYSLPVASAQVKSCVLLAGLYGNETTAVEEIIPTRDHTEIALREFGGTIRISGNWIEVDPEPRLQARQLVVPGDLSGAAFFLVAAALVPGSEIYLPGVSLNGRRRELLTYLERAGIELSVENETEEAGEARGNLRVRYRTALLKRALPPIQGAEVAALIDEIPVLAVLGSQVAGGLEISDAQELRVKESDRIAAVALNLRSMGVEVTEKPDGLIIPGGQRLRGANIAPRNDHRIAMAFAVAALAAQGETRIHDAECANVSFPEFWQALKMVSG